MTTERQYMNMSAERQEEEEAREFTAGFVSRNQELYDKLSRE